MDSACHCKDLSATGIPVWATLRRWGHKGLGDYRSSGRGAKRKWQEADLQTRQSNGLSRTARSTQQPSTRSEISREPAGHVKVVAAPSTKNDQKETKTRRLHQGQARPWANSWNKCDLDTLKLADEGLHRLDNLDRSGVVYVESSQLQLQSHWNAKAIRANRTTRKAHQHFWDFVAR